jgi:hypothetical protein
MFDKIVKILIIVLGTAGLFLVWLSIDNSDTDDEVSVTYECTNLDKYDVVPKEVIEECRVRGLDK